MAFSWEGKRENIRCLLLPPLPAYSQSPLGLIPALSYAQRPYRFLQVAAGQLAVLGVMVENRAELEVCPGLDSLWRLELKHGLQTVHTEPNFGWTRRSEMLRKAEKGEIPALRGLYVWRHFPRQQQVFLRCGQTAGLPGPAACDPRRLPYDFKNVPLCQQFYIWPKSS